jgi:thiamine-phosphate pyrophosphorylase
VEIMQYRDKQATSGDLFHGCERIAQRLRGWSGRLIVNDRADIALMVSAAGVHIGQNDLSVSEVRAIFDGDQWVGISTHTLEQFRRACDTSADYIAIGPIFSTQTKAEHEMPVGIEFVSSVRGLTSKPIVAIGGITITTAPAIYRAGADCSALAGELAQSHNPVGLARNYREIAVAELTGTP